MSRRNVETVRGVLTAWNRHDLETWLRFWDPVCEWVPNLRGQIEGAQTYRGHEGLRMYWDEDAAVWDEFRVEPLEFHETGDEVVVIGTGTARGKGSGVVTTQPFAFRFRLRDGKIVRGESYLDVEQALKAAGSVEDT